MQAWIDQSQGMVRAIATKIFSRLPPNVVYDDLVSYGQLGLMQAVFSFKPDRDVTFQTFAYYRIRGAIYDGLGKMSWTSRAISQRIRAERLSAELLEQQIHASNMQQAAASSSADADWLVRTTERIAIVHLLSENADSNQGLAETVVDQALAPDEAIAHQELCELLRTTVAELPETQRLLIQMTYFEGKSLTEAAEKLGKSKSWASRVHSRILEKLARSLACHGVE